MPTRCSAGAEGDRLEPGPGDDTLAGGGGRDVASFTWSPRGVRVNLSNGTASGWGVDSLTEVEDSGAPGTTTS